MATKPIKEDLIKAFCERYVQSHTGKSVEQVVYHLVKDGLTSRERIRNYMIVADYPALLGRNKGHINDTKYQLSDKYDVSERQIHNILYKWSRKFRNRGRKKGNKKD